MEESRELNAKDLFVDEIPATYITVKLSSMGKLGLPAVIHVRDYTFDEAVLFSYANEDNEAKTILQIIKAITYEDIDIKKLTVQDAIEILMSIQGTWYSPYVEKRYIVDDTLSRDKRFEKENISTAQIPINSIPTKTIDDRLATPINIEHRNIKIKIDYPRLYNITLVKDFIEKKFIKESQEADSLNQKVTNGTAKDEDYSRLAEISQIKDTAESKALNAVQLIEFNGNILESLEDKILAYSKFPVSLINKINKVFTDDFNFGVQNEVTFKDDITGNTITRRFDFRLIDFLSSLANSNDDEYRITFG